MDSLARIEWFAALARNSVAAARMAQRAVNRRVIAQQVADDWEFAKMVTLSGPCR